MSSFYGHISINDSPGPGPGPSPVEQNFNPVRYIDYDGTIVASYTAEQFLALSEHPENPVHDRLTAQGWNWTLADAKTFVNSNGMLDIGQMYITTSGNTEIDIELEADLLSPQLGLGINGQVSINWGDGTPSQTVTGSNVSTVKFTQHIYEKAGEYTISFSVDSGSVEIKGNNRTPYTSLLLCNNSNKVANNYQNSIKNIFIGYLKADHTDISIIRQYAFTNLHNLKGITLSNNITFDSGDNIFGSCESLKSFTVPLLDENHSFTLNRCFPGCYNLKYISFSKSIAQISQQSFQNCFSLKQINIPTTCNGANIFYECTSLKNIQITSNVNSIQEAFLTRCYSLQSVVIPNSVTEIKASAFSNCYNLQSITIPSSVNSIGDSAFNYCYKLHSISFPNKNITLASNVFGRCNFETIELPSLLTAIPSSCFSNCQRLKTLTVPTTVTSIGNSAFYNCYSMQSIHLLPTIPPTLTNTNAFSSIPPDFIIYVPENSLNDYKTATNWSTYASYMVGE